MSYILEALKKAQAERQLGNAPTIHAPQPVQAAVPGPAASRRPLFIGLGAGALVVVAGSLFLWQRTPAPSSPASGAAPGAIVAQADAPAAMAAAKPATQAEPPVASRAPAQSAAASAASNTLEVSAPPAPPPRPVPAAAPVPPPAAAAAPRTVAPATAAAPPRTAAAVPGAPPAAPPVAAPVAAPEDSLPYQQQLPDAVQRELPRVAFGGYMYSANPADRLLLVDKALRHEGEEVAPGLVLEKLMPKAAVMNYRGVRYRVAY